MRTAECLCSKRRDTKKTAAAAPFAPTVGETPAAVNQTLRPAAKRTGGTLLQPFAAEGSGGRDSKERAA